MTPPWLCPRDETCPATTHDTEWSLRTGCRSGKAVHARYAAQKRRSLRRARGYDDQTDPLQRIPRQVNVPAIGVQRRLQALAYMAWSRTAIAERSGLGLTQLRRLAHCDAHGRYVTDRVFASVDAVFDEFGHVWGPRMRTHRAAARKLWVPGSAWDDIDDPDAGPQGLRDPDARRAAAKRKKRWQVAAGAPAARAAPGPVRDPLHYAEVARLTDADHSAGFIARRLGITARTVTRIRAEQRAEAQARQAA